MEAISKEITKSKTTFKFIEEKLIYYKGQYATASAEYVRTGKLSDRLVALKYKAKVELLEELLK